MVYIVVGECGLVNCMHLSDIQLGACVSMYVCVCGLVQCAYVSIGKVCMYDVSSCSSMYVCKHAVVPI